MRYDIKRLVADMKGSEARAAARKPLQREYERLNTDAITHWRRGSGDHNALWKLATEYRLAHPEISNGDEAEYRTLLYSMRAHLRGRQHIKKRYVHKTGVAVLEHWTMERQADYVEHAMRLYELFVEASQVPEVVTLSA